MNRIRRFFGGNLKQYAMLISLAAIVLIFQIITKGVLLVPMNVSNLIFQNAYVIILAVGMLICILTGGNIDLAVGSVVALVGAFAGVFIITLKLNVYLSVVLCLGIGLLIGMWQGFWIAYVRMPSFIVTLSGMLVFRGLTLLILNGKTLAPFPQEYLQYSTGFIPDLVGHAVGYAGKLNITSVVLGVLLVLALLMMQIAGNIGRRRKGYATESALALIIRVAIVGAVVVWLFTQLAKYRGIPTVLVLVGLILLGYSYVTSNTVMGRHIYAIGGNEKAARLSGIKTNKMIFLAYVNMALLAAVGGLVFAARLNSASPLAGQNFELDAIGACYIGGASASGGIGTVGGTLIGALIMGVLNNGMSIKGIDSNTQQVVKGMVLLLAVAFDVISKQKIDLFSYIIPSNAEQGHERDGKRLSILGMCLSIAGVILLLAPALLSLMGIIPNAADANGLPALLYLIGVAVAAAGVVFSILGGRRCGGKHQIYAKIGLLSGAIVLICTLIVLARMAMVMYVPST